MLAAVDLPPVTRAVGPWVGTDPGRALTNSAATRCDTTCFNAKGLQHNLTRTFLFPANRRVDHLRPGPTGKQRVDKKTTRQFVARRAGPGFVAAGRPTSAPASTPSSSARAATEEITVWDLEIEISDSRSVEFLMGIMRDGKAVSQLGFTPDDGMTMTRADFAAVADRALDRLSDLPSAD